MNPVTAKKLLFLFAVIVSYGSIYPANFQMPAADMSVVMQQFLQTCCVSTHAGDILANVLLFIPFGFLGMLAVADSAKSTRLVLFHVFFWGVLLALVLQLVQIYLPSRNQNLQDVAWNFLGIIGGAFAGNIARHYVSQSSSGSRQIVLIPWILISAWLAYRLIPFVPALDFQGIKDSIKPLFLYAELIPKNIFHDTVAWCLIAYFLRYCHRFIRFDVYLLFLILITFFLEIIIVSNTLSASNLMGAGLAIVLWWGVFGRLVKCELILAGILFVMLVYAGLEPFTARTEAIAFNWLPFKGFLGGSMYINAQSICEKSFLYGSLVYMLWRGGFSPVLSTVVAVLGIFIIEYSQTYFVGNHVPEITDPILVVLTALMLFSLKNDTTEVTAGNVPTMQQKSVRKRSYVVKNEDKTQQRYFKQYIDLRTDQINFLKELADEMGISQSRAVRLIVDTVIKDMEQNDDVTDNFNQSSGDQHTDAELEFCTIRLREEQIKWFNQSKQYASGSISHSIRNMIDQFIDGLKKDS